MDAAIGWTTAAETLVETFHSLFPFAVVGLLGIDALLTSRARLEDGLFLAGLAIGPALFTTMYGIHEYYLAAVLFAAIGLVASLIRSVAEGARGRRGSVVAALLCSLLPSSRRRSPVRGCGRSDVGGTDRRHRSSSRGPTVIEGRASRVRLGPDAPVLD